MDDREKMMRRTTVIRRVDGDSPHWQPMAVFDGLAGSRASEVYHAVLERGMTGNDPYEGEVEVAGVKYQYKQVS